VKGEEYEKEMDDFTGVGFVHDQLGGVGSRRHQVRRSGLFDGGAVAIRKHG
jgi:hypothetical protein